MNSIDNILITGGSGFMGINLVRYLLKKGVKNITILDIADFEYPELEKINFVKGDIRDLDMVEKSFENVDYVVHAAAALPSYTEEEIMTTDVDGTRNLLEEGFKRHIKRFVHTSSTAVYGIPNHTPLAESDELAGIGPYGEAKIFAEEECLKFRKKGMVVPIIRPVSFIGPERLGVFAVFYDWAKDGKNFPMIGSGNNRFQFLDVEDLCDVVWSMLSLEPKYVNDTFNIGAKEFSTMKDDYQAVLDEAGFGKKIIPFPSKPVVFVLRVLEMLHLSPLYKWVYETAYRDNFVSIEKAEDKLNFKPKFSNKDALIRNYNWYLKNLSNFENRTGISHRVPWKQGILKLFKIFF